MIGVAASSTDLPIVEEFFELFKTPWERASPARKYPVVLSSEGNIHGLDAELFLIYGAEEHAVDREDGITVEQIEGPVDVAWEAWTFPIYGRVAAFGPAGGASALTLNGKPLVYRYRTSAGTVCRIGYDLFREVRSLLTDGQPASQGPSPTLELHIALLRHVLAESGVAFVEIPPRPAGYDFVCCLTHDVDFFGIRRHKFDRTLAGFVGRASLKTLADLARGRRPLVQAARNWMALLSLPLVFLKLAPDFWRPFDDYARVEEGSRSTFFLVPFKGRPGMSPNGTVDPARAVSYEVSEIRKEMSTAARRGSELAVHGIDAWLDADAGRAEMNQLTASTGRASAGVRMHWLYFAADSPRRLEAAGFDYDSTWGYNDGIGYRAGTSQVFRLPASAGLMELPLSIMDSALFYPSRMNRSQADAWEDCSQIVANARRFGGTVVINWHDRSLAPERLWDHFYRELITEVGKGDRAWFATARDAVDWFRWRRSFRFSSETNSRCVTVHASPTRSAGPDALVRIHRPAGGLEVVVEERRLDGREAMRLEF